MKRCLLPVLLAALLLAGYLPAQAKKGGNPHDDDDQGEYMPPGQAKKHGPPPWAPAHGYRAKQRYRYYPAHNIYQDPVSGLYFTLQAGGMWIKGALPMGMSPNMLGTYKEFDGYQDEPWKNNPYRR